MKKLNRDDIGEEYLLEQAGWKVHECDKYLTVVTHAATGQFVELWGEEELDFKLLKLTTFISNKFKNQYAEFES